MSLDQKLLMWAAIGQFVVALATFVAVVVAIWGERLKLRFGLGPALVLVLVDAEGELISTPPPTTGMYLIRERYYHLRVSNRHRWAQATNVRIVLTRLERPAADGSLTTQPLSGPLQLMWRFADAHPQYSIVGPDDICDLGRVRTGDPNTPPGFLLSTYVFPNNFAGHLQGNGRMRAELRAVADNAESEPLKVDIAWDGNWSDDTAAMATHLVVKAVASSR